MVKEEAKLEACVSFFYPGLSRHTNKTDYAENIMKNLLIHLLPLLLGCWIECFALIREQEGSAVAPSAMLGPSGRAAQPRRQQQLLVAQLIYAMLSLG